MEPQTTEGILNDAVTHLEKLMVNLPPKTKKHHAAYLAGVIDTMFEYGEITEEIRDELYSSYGP